MQELLSTIQRLSIFHQATMPLPLDNGWNQEEWEYEQDMK